MPASRYHPIPTFGTRACFDGNLYKNGQQADMSTQLWVWENYTMYPREPGWMGPFGPGYSIPSASREYPHASRLVKGYNALYRDGHAAFKAL